MMNEALSCVDKFYKHIFGEEKSQMSSSMEFIASANIPDYHLFCFIEGDDDEKFYRSVLPNITKLKANQIAFIYNGKEDDEKRGGKDSVYFTLSFLLSKNIRFGRKAVFIVDHDYEGIKKSWKDESAKNNLTLLPCYSIENFFFSPEANLIKVFKMFFMFSWKEYLKKFQKEFTTYLKDIGDYCAWKMICELKPNKTDRLKYNRWKDSEENYESAKCILSNILRDKNYLIQFQLPKSFDDFVNKAMEELKINYNTLYCEMINYRKKIVDDVKLPKGKLLFDFLIKFLIQYGDYGDKDIKADKDVLFILAGEKQFELGEFQLNYLKL